MKSKFGHILRIEKSSIHDGDGLRTVVFFKGCPLKCLWCSTPESQSFAITEQYGKHYTVEEVVKEIVKDEIFFFHSGGGVTLSGGEVLLQADFAAAILKQCMQNGIHTAIETSLFGSFEEIEKLLPYLCDLYVDIKAMDEQIHQQVTGISNRTILENIKKVEASPYPVQMRVRIPVVPHTNVNEDMMRSVGVFCKDLKKVTEIELLPYHRLGVDTYRKMGIQYQLPHILPPSEAMLSQYADLIKQKGGNKTVRFLGQTR